MTLSRVTLGKIAFGWAIFLWSAAMVLLNLGSHTRAHPFVKAIIAVVYTLFLIGTPIALTSYFNRAWRLVANGSKQDRIRDLVESRKYCGCWSAWHFGLRDYFLRHRTLPIISEKCLEKSL